MTDFCLHTYRCVHRGTVHIPYLRLCLYPYIQVACIAPLPNYGLLASNSMQGKVVASVLCVVQTLPLYAVTHDRLGVLGTREYALRLLKTPDVTKGYYAVVEAARRGDLFKHGTV